MPDPLSDLRDLVPAIDTALAARAQEWPRRGPAFQASADAISRFADALLRSLDPAWQPDPARVELAAPAGDRAAVICGAMKSGTTLLVQLLDGHPDLLALPGDSHMAAGFAPPTNPRAAFDAVARHWTHRLINPTGQPPFWTLGHDPARYAAVAHYLRHFFSTLPPSSSRPFRALVLAWAATDEFRLSTPRWFVEKTPDNELRVPAILAEFPAARFVHVLRHPLAIAAALKKLSAQRQWPYDAGAVAAGIRRGMLAALSNRDALGPDRYFILRYEDLVADPAAWMERLSSFLDIPFTPALLAPTIAARPALSNSMFAERQSRGQILVEAKEAFADRITRELYADERAAVTASFRDEAFGYDML